MTFSVKQIDKGGYYMKGFKKLTAGLMGVVMALGVCGFTALADDEDEKYAVGATIEISSEKELVAAIKNQKDRQTWILAKGEYDVYNEDNRGVYNFSIKSDPVKPEEKGFAFPITANNLTIKAEDGADVVITSSYNPGAEQGGAWHNQNFITISGERVTIEGIDIKGNPNAYYDDTCNKAIELIDRGKNLTLRDVEILPEDSNGKLWSGSIYYNVEDAGKCVLEDVTLYAWINARKVTGRDSKIVADGVVMDFRDNTYAGYNDKGKYSFNPGISGTNVEIKDFTIKVDDKTKIEEQVFNDQLKDGTTIELEEGTYKTNKSITIKKDVNIIGNGSTISVEADLNDNENGSKGAIEINGGANVKIEDITVEGNNKVKHVVNIYSGKDDELATVELDGVTLKNGTGYGIVNNSSNLVIKDVETSGNNDGGINVDNKYNVSDSDFVMESGNITEDTSIKVEKSVYNENDGITKVTINGGEIKGNVEVKEQTDVTIKGGAFDGEIMAVNKENVNIVSGNFKTDVSDYIDEYSHIVKIDGEYVVMDEDKYDDYLDDQRDSGRHSYSLKEGKTERDDEEEEPVVTPEPEEEEGPFSDVGKDNPNYDAIIEVYEKGWMAGIGDGVFAPNGTLTRGMAVTILWNRAGQPEPASVAPFLDVTSDAWYAKAVAWAYENGITSGYGDTYGPDDFLTTEQFTRMNDIANGRTPEVYVGGAPYATRGWVAGMLVME